jgi:pilus assembly protein CpaC
MWPSQKFACRVAAPLAYFALFSAPVAAADRELLLNVSHGELINLAQPAGSVFVADPAIAGVQVPSDRQLFVFGKKAGQTTLFVLGDDGKQIASMIVTVRTSIADAQSAVDAVVPDQSHVAGSVVGASLRGNFASPEAAYTAAHTVEANLGEGQKLRNDAKILSSTQVTLRVRFAEVDRSVEKSLGFDWNTAIKAGAFSLGFVTGRTPTFSTSAPILFNPDASAAGSAIASGVTSGFSTQTVIDALAEEGLVTLLAEPTLTALSGESASFLAGGEFPIPVAQPGGVGTAATITVEYKDFGVSLNFVPTVLASNRISLHVKPEVSQLITATGGGAVDVSGFVIPALSVRRADTTLELGSGESFAMAGLLQNTTNTNMEKMPGLGDLPVLGPLFRSTSFQRAESELVVIVTPYITQPIADPRSIRLPTDGLAPANDIDLILRGRVAARNPPAADGVTAASADAPHLAGSAGFDIE